VELADLRRALDDSGVPQDRREALIADYGKARETLSKYIEEKKGWEERKRWQSPRAEEAGSSEGTESVKSEETPPKLPRLHIPKGIPAEFAHYLRGAIEYHQGQIPRARTAWRVLLSL